MQRDDSGRAVLDVRWGADASAYGRAEKAPGTGLARVPVELFERLAAGSTIESVADFEHAHARAHNSNRATETSEREQPAAAAEEPRARRSDVRALLAVAVLAVLGGAAWLMRRRTN